MYDIKATVAQNIASHRRAMGLTQLDLAERLNYSDKAISKWERGESLPDLSTLLALSDLFGVTLDSLVRKGEKADPVAVDCRPSRKSNKPAILLLSILLVWSIAVAIFVVLSLAPSLTNEWLCFVAAAPASTVVWLVLNTLWFRRSVNYPIISLLLWSLLAFAHLLLFCLGYRFWMIYLLGIPGQLSILVWSRMRFGKRSRRR